MTKFRMELNGAARFFVIRVLSLMPVISDRERF
jgi:hypothetical protein